MPVKFRVGGGGGLLDFSVYLSPLLGKRNPVSVREMGERVREREREIGERRMERGEEFDCDNI